MNALEIELQQILKKTNGMKKAKKIMLKLPEGYILLLTLMAGFTPPFHFNPILLVIAALLLLQLIFQATISGILLGGLFLIVNIFLLGALISEMNEFQGIGSDSISLLIGGSLLWFTNTFFSFVLIYKYMRFESTPDLQAEQ